MFAQFTRLTWSLFTTIPTTFSITTFAFTFDTLNTTDSLDLIHVVAVPRHLLPNERFI
jgi:hypothetical protein